MTLIRFFDALDRHSLLLAGGKGANLGELAGAGFPVPQGFVITTEVYQTFVAKNQLQRLIAQQCAGLNTEDPDSLDKAARTIRTAFENGVIPPALCSAMMSGYAQLCQSVGENQFAIPAGNMAVAVRSSATAEDLPDLSFAGQQDTLLNVIGQDALMDAVRRVWGSLWSARAIGYRARNRIPQESVTLAVVVQQMVQSEVSGVLFTANPLTGKRSETVIDATLGLGEALVSGLVEPDQYIVDASVGRILRKAIGAKALSIRSNASGGVTHLEETSAGKQALPDEQIIALARLGQRVAEHFGSPQDIEFAVERGHIFLVQSRPVTSLFPIPELFKAGDRPLNVMFSFGAVQGVLDPFTPLGQDLFNYLAAGIGRIYGLNLTPSNQTGLLVAGERLWINVTNLLRYPLGRRFLDYAFSVIDPVFHEAVMQLVDDPRLPPMAGPIKLKTRVRFASILIPAGVFILRGLISPARMRARQDRKIDAFVAQAQSEASTASGLTQRMERFEQMLLTTPTTMLVSLVPTVAVGQAVFQPLVRIASHLPGGRETALELTRGLPHNVTTEMDLALWDVARAIHGDPAALAAFQVAMPSDLANACLRKALPPITQQAVDGFLAKYGSRGLAEIDMGRIRWREDPTPLMQVLKSYLEIPESASPRAMFERGADQAAAARDRLISMIRKMPGGWIKSRIAAFASGRVRELTGLRETPKFAIIRMLGQWRAALLADGQALVERGLLDQPDDLFFLYIEEIKQGAVEGWRALVAERRAVYEREKRRKQIPRMLLSDGTAIFETAAARAESGSSLTGSPVSPGVVEGTVRVVYDPHGARLEPGEILACPGTDPSWTPLFLAAGGLVMEVGGMMTHGAVVAREYGIPAVASVTQATTRLKTGQRVRVDGSTGQVTILSEPA